MFTLVNLLRRVLRPALSVIATALVFASAAASAATYSNIVVFGDSLSDPGNLFAKTAIPQAGFTGFPPPPYVGGHFSNGITAPEYVSAYAASLGISSVNYAEGGATTGIANINNNRCVPSNANCLLRVPPVGLGLTTQVQNYLAATPVISPNTLFLIQGGGNNFFLDSVLGGTANIQAIPTDLQSIVTSLAGRGARNIVLQNLPDLSTTPYGFGLGAGQPLVQGAIQQVNAGIAQLWAGFASIVTPFDSFGFLNSIIANPIAFGITNATTPCISSAAALAANCAGYLYFDDVHPTTFVHQLVSQRLITAARIPEPGTLALFGVLAISFAMFARRRPARVNAKR